MAIYRCGVVTTYPVVGGPAYNTFHYRTQDDVDVEDELGRAEEGLLAAYTAIRGQVPNTVSYTFDGRWVNLSTDGIVQTEGFQIAGLASGTFDWLPGMSTICIGWQTSSASRSGKGRTFISPWSEQQNQNGVPTASAVAACRAFAAAIVAVGAGATTGAFTVHSPTFNLDRDIIGAAVRPVWASLRSRRD